MRATLFCVISTSTWRIRCFSAVSAGSQVLSPSGTIAAPSTAPCGITGPILVRAVASPSRATNRCSPTAKRPRRPSGSFRSAWRPSRASQWTGWNTDIHTAGFAHDEIGLEHDAAAASAGLPGNALEEKLGPQAAEGLGRLIDHGEKGRQHSQVLDIVVTHKPDVIGHRELSFAQRLHGADRGPVVDCKDRSRKGIERQHLLGGAIAPDTIDGGAKHQILGIGDAGCFECLPITFQTVAAGRD